MAQKLFLPKKVITALKPKIPKPECPNCNSNLNVNASGIHRGKRQFYCKPCKRSFIFPYFEPKSNSPKPSHSGMMRRNVKPKETNHCSELPFLNVSPEMMKRINKPLPSLDSIVGIPCFGCLDANRGCNPNICQKMEIYLLKEVENNV